MTLLQIIHDSFSCFQGWFAGVKIDLSLLLDVINLGGLVLHDSGFGISDLLLLQGLALLESDVFLLFLSGLSLLV